MPVLSTLGAAIANVYGFTSGLIKDQYFNLVSLLLPGNGTDGKQNRTFKDSSVNDFLITPNGNATQGTFSPFSQTGWGAYFDGSNDYVSNSTLNSAYAGDFTFEAWVYISSLASNMYFFGQGSETTNRWVFGTTSAGRLFANPYGGSDIFFGNNGDVTAGSWLHIAFVRSGSGTNNITGYLNGQSKGTGTSTATVGNSGGFGIGAGQNGSGPVSGYMSNVRYTAQAIYTSNFTPSVVPLTTTSQGASSSNVKVLALQNNRFIDNASTPNTLTANNGVAITPFSPFAPTQSYSASAVGGSGYFDGTGDYLTVGYNANLQLGSSDFTIDFWFYSTGAQDSGDVIANGYTSGTNLNWLIQADVSTVKFYASTTGTGAWAVSALTVGTIVHNQWNHFCVTRSGTTVTPYLNGTAGTTGSLTGSVFSNSSGIAIATDNSSPGTLNIQGYLSDFRIIIGSAVAPPSGGPTSPATAVTNTKLLLNFTNAGVVDATAKNVLETVGNAQISTTQSKWGGGSINFASASNSNLLGNTPSNWTYLHDGSSWTVEFWLYPTDVSSFQGLICTNRAGSSYIGLGIAINSSTITLSFTRGVSGSSASFTSSAVLNANQWNYVGITFTNSTKTCAFFINGASAGSSSNTGFSYSSSAPSNPPYIGQTGDSSFPYYFNGYIDDLRITRGIARTITANPTAPFPVQ